MATVVRTRSLTKPRSPSVKSAQRDSSTEPPPVPNIPHAPVAEANGDAVHADKDKKDTTHPKSPLLTAHRLSTTSLDNVSLDEEESAKPQSPKGTSPRGQLPSSIHANTLSPVVEAPRPPSLPPKTSKTPLQGLSGVLPSVPWSPPPPPPPAATHIAPPPAPPTRKLTSPFSWLSRNTPAPKESVMSPPLISPNNERRNTASSIATIGSNPEMMLSKLEEGDETDAVNKKGTRNSLRDRFKLLRMREEAGITGLAEDDLAGKNSSLGLSHGQERELTLAAHSPSSPHPTSPNPATVNPALAPGTASGVSAGPSAMSDPAAPVDWDLWQSVVYEGPTAVARTSAEELNRAIAAGIPHAIRGVVWQVLAQSKNEDLESVYRDLVARGTDKEKDRMSTSSGVASMGHSSGSASGREEVVSSASSVHSDHSTPAYHMNGLRSPSPPKDADALAKAHAASLAQKKKKAKEDAASLQRLEKAIRRDLGARTSYSKFAASAGLQEGLFGLCKAYALFDEGVGYAQGMNFLAMPLLFNMPEEEAFCLLVRLMNKYQLRDLFIQDMPGLHMHLYQFERLLEDFEPALYCHLHRRQVTPHLYATQWFLTLFAYRFPLQLVLRIYDLILSEGLAAILKFGIVLMQKNAATLLGMNDMVALTTFLKDRLFDVYIDQTPSAGSILESGFFGSSGASIDKEVYRADHLIQDACAVKITPEVLKTYSLEWEEKTRLEKERETELDNLKSTNHALSLKVRRLEERVEDHDTEHAALATDLVKTKVDNEELKDENESLKGQVRELRIVVEKQPEEVEARLKSEMDRLMKRNQEVHEENTKLEEEMSEMEHNLVETKMMYAERAVRSSQSKVDRPSESPRLIACTIAPHSFITVILRSTCTVSIPHIFLMFRLFGSASKPLAAPLMIWLSDAYMLSMKTTWKSPFDIPPFSQLSCLSLAQILLWTGS
ncbi:rab-GTPase-TBC domain-containing protein [Amylocarpus encephaloides]|uniref:GTPase-activating protein GYP5 n=1 Tax=Amylocarpus encephaloides TaxID=45428 RepID=A0A9P7YKT3_9HELO|nr:rab-GTPase-TBC domain-containing protein [Amylocarpus encephaloides]